MAAGLGQRVFGGDSALPSVVQALDEAQSVGCAQSVLPERVVMY